MVAESRHYLDVVDSQMKGSRPRKGRRGAAAIALGAAVLVVVSSLLNHNILRCVNRGILHPGRQTPEGLKEVFATIWASELEKLFNISSVGVLPPRAGAMFNLDEVLDDLKGQGVGLIFTSFRWSDVETAPGVYNYRLQDYVQQAVCSRGLRLIALLDVQASPKWLDQHFSDSVVVDATGQTQDGISFTHGQAVALAYRWFDASLQRLVGTNGRCLHSASPSFNNEYETKYTQVHDAFQDYSPSSQARFRAYFQSVYNDIGFWNRRWKQGYADFADIRMVEAYQHGPAQHSAATDVEYWDFQHYRNLVLKEAYEHACIRIASQGVKCTLHFCEFFAGSDAIYASGVFFSLMRSPWVDYSILDSNFMSIWHRPNDPRIVEVLLAAAKPYGTPTFFEAAFERETNLSLYAEAAKLTALSGTHGMGFTNWMTRVPQQFFSTVLMGGNEAGGLDYSPAVALVTPYRSYYAVRGISGDESDGKDVMQERVFRCLDAIEGAVGTLRGLQVFGEPSLLLASIASFQEVWYLEPHVLLSGDKKLLAIIEERAAAHGIGFHVFHSDQSPAVIEECCPYS